MKLKLLTESTNDNRKENTPLISDDWENKKPGPIADMESLESSDKSELIE